MALESQGRRFDVTPSAAPGLSAVVIGEQVLVFENGDVHEFTLARAEASGAGAPMVGGVISPMPGRVIAVAVKAGDDVTKGQPLLTLEAMKMEHTLTAPRAAKIEAVLAQVGDQVGEGVPLVRLSPTKSA